jgi:hypothetical protein
VPLCTPLLPRGLHGPRRTRAAAARPLEALCSRSRWTSLLDTVGTAGYNLKLSQARAQSLARWFRQRGVRIPISFEGVGETALKGQTPDQTDEPRDRRADYIIADDAPPCRAPAVSIQAGSVSTSLGTRL